MQKYISLFFLVLLYLTACKSDDVPDGVLNKPEMISLLTDLHLTDGQVYTVPQVPDSMYKYTSEKYKVLFKRHHTTDAVFNKSLKYYTTQPEVIMDMYDKIEATLKAKLDSVNRPAASPKTKAHNNITNAIPAK
jgi:hypothetical protein